MVARFFNGKRLFVDGKVAHADECCCGPTVACSALNVDENENQSINVSQPSLIVADIGTFTNGTFGCEMQTVKCPDVDGEWELSVVPEPEINPCARNIAFLLCGANSSNQSGIIARLLTNNAGDLWWQVQVRLRTQVGIGHEQIKRYDGNPLPFAAGRYFILGSHSLTQTFDNGGFMCVMPGGIDLIVSSKGAHREALRV